MAPKVLPKPVLPKLLSAATLFKAVSSTGGEFNKINQAMQSMAADIQKLAAEIEEIKSHIGAPTEIIRDKAGQPVRARKGNHTMNIRRGPGGIAGFEPVQ